ncbi:MAG TPA: DUF1648 domain-containing protein [Clostridia bacterium]
MARPKLRLPLSPVEKVIQVVSATGLAGIIIMLFTSWPSMPDKIPNHFGPSGGVDSWGGKGILFLLPIIMTFMYGLLTIIERIPHLYNYMCEITEENAEFQYRNARMMLTLLKIEIIFLFGYIEWQMMCTGLGKSTGLGIGFLPVYLLILFGTVGFFTYRMAKHGKK